jgi:hypothetical protein
MVCLMQTRHYVLRIKAGENQKYPTVFSELASLPYGRNKIFSKAYALENYNVALASVWT